MILVQTNQGGLTMNTNGSTKLPYLIVAGLGAIGGALSVLLARKESREYIREHGAKGLEYLSQTSAKLRERTAGLVGKGRELMSGCCATTDTTGESATMPSMATSPRSTSANGHCRLILHPLRQRSTKACERIRGTRATVSLCRERRDNSRVDC
jgi:hypothetical protein